MKEEKHKGILPMSAYDYEEMEKQDKRSCLRFSIFFIVLVVIAYLVFNS